MLIKVSLLLRNMSMRHWRLLVVHHLLLLWRTRLNDAASRIKDKMLGSLLLLNRLIKLMLNVLLHVLWLCTRVTLHIMLDMLRLHCRTVQHLLLRLIVNLLRILYDCALCNHLHSLM